MISSFQQTAVLYLQIIHQSPCTLALTAMVVAFHHCGAAQVTEAVHAPADDVHTTFYPLDVDLALGAPLPLALVRDFPQLQILPPALVLAKPLELGAVDAVMARHLALRAEHPTAVRALHVVMASSPSTWSSTSITEQSLKGQ